MKKKKWERWMAGACLLVLLGSFFSPMAVGKARAEMDSAEEILSTLGTSPAKIYANYITGIDRVVEDTEGKLLYDAMLSEPESYFLCMTLDDDLGLSADVAVWYSYLMEGKLSDITERLNFGSYEAAVLLDILASNVSVFAPLETDTAERIEKLGKYYEELQDFDTLVGVASVDVPGLKDLKCIPESVWGAVDITAENLLEGSENLAKLYEIYAQRESMIMMLTEMRQNCMGDAYMQAGIDIVLGSLQEESVWEGAEVWKNIQAGQAGTDALEYMITFGVKQIPILNLAVAIREVMPVVINEAIFDFDEFNGQMRMVEVTERYTRTLIATAKTLNAQYAADPTEENARKCVEAFKMMYRLALYDKDLFGTFAQVLLRSGALTARVKDAFGTKYSGILANLNEMREDIKDSYARIERVVDAYTSFQVEKGIAPTPVPVTLPSTEWGWVLEPFIEADDIQPVASVYVLLESGYWGQGESGHIQKEMALWVDGKVGLIDYEGNVLIEPLYEDLYYYARYDMYMLKANGRDYAYIDNQVQEVDIQNYDFGYDEYGDEGLSEYFYWDDDLKHVMCIATEGGPSYTHNMEIVREGCFGNYPYGKYGLAKENQILIPMQFEYGFHTMGAAYDYSHNFYNAKEAYIFWDGEAWTYYDADGQMIIANCDEAWLNSEEDRIYGYAGAKPPFNFSEGMLAFGQDGKWGYCDEEGQIKIPQVFEATRPVSPSGLAWVKQGGKWGVIRALPRFATEQFMCTLLEDGSVRIEEYKGMESTVQVPSVLAGCNVSEIGKQAFLDCEMLQRVELPEGLTVIGDGAFGECHSLIRIELPEKLTTVGDKAFYMCESLDGVELPEGLTTIGDEAFSGCVSLSSVELPGGLMAIGDSTFSWCDSLRSIELPEGLTTIGDGAFSGCDSLLSIELPEGLTTIGDEAFSGCDSLLSIELPGSLTAIGDMAFSWCSSLRSIKLLGSLTAMGDRAFSWCYSLRSIELPDGLTTIGDRAFLGCSSLRSIELPEGLTEIGDEAFSDCSSLRSVELLAGLTTIGDEAFYSCDSLNSVTIPASVTEIGEGAFLSCNALILTVGRGSYAHEYAETHDIPYTYLDTLDWLMD